MLLYVSLMVTTKQKPIVNVHAHTHTHTHMRERNISVSLKKMSSNYKGEVREEEGNRETQQLENNFY